MSTSQEHHAHAKDSTRPIVKQSGMTEAGGMSDRQAEERLVTQAREGDPDAFEQLCRRHYLMVYRVAYRFCGRREDAQDVAQDTFVKAARAIRAFRGEARVTTWLYRIAFHAATDLLRRRRRQPEAFDPLPEPPEAIAAPVPSDGRVLSLLDRLPAKQRTALVLTVYEDMSHAEAARTLGCAEATVSWRVHMARNTLRKWLGTSEG